MLDSVAYTLSRVSRDDPGAWNTSNEPDGWLGFGPEPSPEPAVRPTQLPLHSSSEPSSAPPAERSATDPPPVSPPPNPKKGVPSAYVGYSGDDSLMELMGLPTQFGTTNPALAGLQAAQTEPPAQAQPKRKPRRGKRHSASSASKPAPVQDPQAGTIRAPVGFDPVPVPPQGLPPNVTLKVATMHMPQWQLPNSQRRLEGEVVRKRPLSDVDHEDNPRPHKRRPTPQDDVGELNYFPDERTGEDVANEAGGVEGVPSGEEGEQDEEFWMGIPKWVRPHVLIRKEDMEEEMRKYWFARYTLFSHFDDGYALDRESWYSITPEGVANQISRRMASVLGRGAKVNGRYPGRVLDAFCGAGGNVVAFARRFEHVVGIDIDPVKVELAKHNARVAGVEDRVTIICADVLQWAEIYARRRDMGSGTDSASKAAQETSLRGEWDVWDQWVFDAVFLSPPWGGIDYQEAPQSSHPTEPAATEADSVQTEGPRPAPAGSSSHAPLETETAGPSQASAPQVPEDDEIQRVTAEHKVAELEEALAAVPAGAESKQKRKRLRWKLNQARTHLLSLYDAVLSKECSSGKKEAPPAVPRVSESETDSLYSLSRLTPLNGEGLVRLCTSQLGTANVALFLPRNTGWDDLAHLGTVAHENGSPDDAVLVEREVNGRKLVAVTCYLGALAQHDSAPQEVAASRSE